MQGLRDAIIARLLTIPEFKGEVGGSTTLEASKKDLKRTPACVVTLMETEAEGIATVSTGSADQKLIDYYMIYIVIDNMRSIRGDDTFSEYDVLRFKVREKLMGWIPQDDSFATQFQGGSVYFDFSEKNDLRDIERQMDNLIIWGELYSFPYNYCVNITN